MEVILGDFRIYVWPVVALALVAATIMGWRRERSLSYLLCATIFGVYLLLALDKIFFPIAISGFYADFMHDVPFQSFINLVPFNFNLSEQPELVYERIFQNILLTVPFGFGVNFVARLRVRRVLWLALAVGLGIEAGQLVISLLLGYPYRVIDVNDVLLNALGVLIGYGAFRVFAWVYVRVMRRVGIGRRGLAGYICEVTSWA